MENEKNKDKPRVIVYDADFIPFYVCHNKKDEVEKTLENCISGCNNLIYNMNKSIKADFYCGFLTKGKCFRYKINPTYKANRNYDKLPKYLNEVRQYMLKSHKFMFKRGYEGDDLVTSFKTQNSQFETIIVSPDKDILGSVESAYNPRKNEFVSTSKEQIIENFWKSMITGDSVDGIKGIPGWGEASFNKIKESLKFGTINMINHQYMETILHCYCNKFGEYEGIKEFTKNYLSLKLLDTVILKNIKLNKVEKETI